jgi:transposase
MPRQPTVILRPLAPDELAALTRVARSQSDRVDRVRRARALLAVSQGQSLAYAARTTGFRSVSSISALIMRFNAGGLRVLQIAPGRGRKPTYAPAARAQIVATAQRPPDRRMDGTATWSLSLLRRTLRRDGLPRIGTSTIRRVLVDAGSSYQRTRSWCPTGTAKRVRKQAVVTVVDPATEQKRG